MRTFLRVVLISLAAALPALAVRGQAPGPADRTEASLVVEQFDVAGCGADLLVPVRFHGKVYRFVCDTGSTFSV